MLAGCFLVCVFVWIVLGLLMFTLSFFFFLFFFFSSYIPVCSFFLFVSLLCLCSRDLCNLVYDFWSPLFSKMGVVNSRSTVCSEPLLRGSLWGPLCNHCLRFFIRCRWDIGKSSVSVESIKDFYSQIMDYSWSTFALWCYYLGQVWPFEV